MSEPARVLWTLALSLEPHERRRVLAWLLAAHRLMCPRPSIAYGKYPDAAERRRRALQPRPNEFYPGGPDFGGA